MRSLIDKNTVCLVASSPDYAYGMFDPIEEIAAMAK
jgi:glutamate/tyrosine decarboxylase-like PLP-dependent enzyme